MFTLRVSIVIEDINTFDGNGITLMYDTYYCGELNARLLLFSGVIRHVFNIVII